MPDSRCGKTERIKNHQLEETFSQNPAARLDRFKKDWYPFCGVRLKIVFSGEVKCILRRCRSLEELF
jgi:hypothetical protein